MELHRLGNTVLIHVIYSMANITLKEIHRRFKSEEPKDVQWVVNVAMIFMATIGVLLVGFIIYTSI